MGSFIQATNQKYEGKSTPLDTEQSLIKLMEDYSQDVMWLAFSYVKDIHIAEDLTQEVFIKCYQNLNTFKGEASIRTWLFSITINRCKDYLKSSYFRRIIPSIMKVSTRASSDDTPERRLETKFKNEKLSEYLLSMPLKYREVIILYYFQDLKIREISNLLKINENTVKTRIRKAKSFLIDQYKKDGGNWEYE